MKLIALNALYKSATDAANTANAANNAEKATVTLANDANPLELPLEGVQRVELNFPKFTDGRAFSQAFLLRRRRGFTGEIRATGDVLVDQLVQMQRSGFDTAVLRADLDQPGIDAIIERQFARYPAFYQGDAITTAPHFARAAA